MIYFGVELMVLLLLTLKTEKYYGFLAIALFAVIHLGQEKNQQ
jgi:uncharacterized membrane protein YedE/YeeE